VVEQRGPVRIGIYCDRCRRRSGRRQLLADVLQDAEGNWWVGVAERTGRRAAEGAVGPSPSPRLQWRLENLHANGLPAQRSMRRDAGSRTVLLTLQPGQTAKLICPDKDCPHKPSERWEALVEQAKQTVAAGRADTYV
jgi:hypothetical protein